MLNVRRRNSAARSSFVSVGWSTRRSMRGFRSLGFEGHCWVEYEARGQAVGAFRIQVFPPAEKINYSDAASPAKPAKQSSTPSGGLERDADRRSLLRERWCAAYAQKIGGGAELLTNKQGVRRSYRSGKAAVRGGGETIFFRAGKQTSPHPPLDPHGAPPCSDPTYAASLPKATAKMRSRGLMLSVCAATLSRSVGFFSGGSAFTRCVRYACPIHQRVHLVHACSCAVVGRDGCNKRAKDDPDAFRVACWERGSILATSLGVPPSPFGP